MKKTQVTASIVLATMMMGIMPTTAFATPQLEGLTNQEKIQVLDNEIVTSMEKVESLTKSIEEKETDLKSQYEELIKTNEEYEKQKENVNIKSNNLYKNNNIKMLDLILGSNSFSEFFQNLDLSRNIIKENNKNIKRLSQKEDELLTKQDNLKEELTQLSDDKKTLEEEKSNLEAKKKEVEEEIAKMPTVEGLNVAPFYQPLPELSASASESGKAIVNEAYKYLGVPYVWGGNTPSGFDCSGFVKYVFEHAVGISLPRTSQEQQMVGTRVPLPQIQPGDLVFFGYPAHHVGIYIGNGQYIHAPRTGDVVRIANLSDRTVSSISRVI